LKARTKSSGKLYEEFFERREEGKCCFCSNFSEGEFQGKDNVIKIFEMDTIINV